ncbi:MAG: hypothetical protein AB1404_07670 [Spirochaetota bacterium]
MTEQNQGISELNEDDEISLVDLAATIFKHRKLLIFSVLGSAIVIVLISIISLYGEPTCQDHFKEKIRWIEYGDSSSESLF